jgi:hypothetical protein
MKHLCNHLQAISIKMLCLIASAWFFSCAFGDEDAVKSLFQDEKDPLFIATGDNTISASLNGRDWVGDFYPYPSGPFYRLEQVTYGAERFMAVGNVGAQYAAFFSKDGFIWGSNAVFQSQVYGVAYYNNRFIAVGINAIYVSEDGFVWLGPINLSGETMVDMAVGNDRIVAVGGFAAVSGRAYVSKDGLAWGGPFIIGTFQDCYQVAFGKDKFVAVGDSGKVAVSIDGITWLDIQIPPFNTFNSIAYGNGLFVAMDNANGVYTSVDGIAWTRNSLPTPFAMQDVIYCHNRFVAVGVNGFACMSNDGISWQQSQASPRTLYGVSCRL